MTTDPIQLERRSAQRFDFHLAITVRRSDTEIEGHGFTQDLSGRGALFYTDFDLAPNDAVELTLVMPSEITLTQSMRVRCRGKVIRVIPPVAGNRRGVAVHLEGYESLPLLFVVVSLTSSPEWTVNELLLVQEQTGSSLLAKKFKL